MTKELAPRARFEPPTFRLTAEMIENLSALSGVAYKKLGAIFSSLVAPTPAPTPMASDIDYCQSVIRSVEVADLLLLPTPHKFGLGKHGEVRMPFSWCTLGAL